MRGSLARFAIILYLAAWLVGGGAVVYASGTASTPVVANVGWAGFSITVKPSPLVFNLFPGQTDTRQVEVEVTSPDTDTTWGLTVNWGDLSTGAASIPKKNLTVNGQSPANDPVTLTSGQKGTKSLPFTAKLSVPATQPEGSYTTQMVWQLIAQ